MEEILPFTNLVSKVYHRKYSLYPLTNYETNPQNQLIYWNTIRSLGLT